MSKKPQQANKPIDTKLVRNQKYLILAVSSHDQLQRAIIQILYTLDPNFGFDFVYIPNEQHENFDEQLKQAHVLIGVPQLLQRLQNPSSCPNIRWFMSLYPGAEKLLQIAPHYRNTPPPFVTSRSVQFYGPIIAEYVLGAVIMLHRNFLLLTETQKRQESPFSVRQQCLQQRQISQLRFGILGATGMIGQDVARRLHVMGAKLWGLYRRKRLEGEPLFNPQFEPQDCKQLLPPASECYERMFLLEDSNQSKETILRDFLSGVDVVLNALPSTPDSDYLLGGGKAVDKDQYHPLKYCKPSCIFINVGRASIISEQEIILALKNNWIKTAILDVFEKEPITQSNILLTSSFSVNRLILTPHISGALQLDTIFEQLLAENLKLFAKGMVEERATGKPWIPNLYYMMNWKQGY